MDRHGDGVTGLRPLHRDWPSDDAPTLLGPGEPLRCEDLRPSQAARKTVLCLDLEGFDGSHAPIRLVVCAVDVFQIIRCKALHRRMPSLSKDLAARAPFPFGDNRRIEARAVALELSVLLVKLAVMGNRIPIELHSDARLGWDIQTSLMEQQGLTQKVVLHDLHVLLMGELGAVNCRQYMHGGRGRHAEIAERMLDHRDAEDPAHRSHVMKCRQTAKLVWIRNHYVRRPSDEHIPDVVSKP